MNAGGFEHPDYEVFGELGRGAFGTVYRARRKGMQDCAVKVFDPGRVDLARAARELEKLQRVQEHRGVVTVYDFDLSGEAPFYAMGLHAERGEDGAWRGRTLAALCGKVSEREAWRLIGEVAEALAYLHEHEVIHCDVKPGNVLLTDERPVGAKVCDFGQSRGSAAQWGERAGTVGYAAPEQLERPGESGEGRGYRWDVYGFGVTAFELLTGKWPRLEGWRNESAGEAATLRESLLGASLREGDAGGVVADVVARLRAEGGAVKWPAGAKLDREWCAVIERCLDLDPQKRFGDMRAVAEAVRAVETRRALERSRRILATVCGLAGLALLGGIGAAWQWREAERAHRSAEEGRSRAEVLVDFMTSEMKGKLQSIGRLELMDTLLQAVERYHANRDKAEAEGRERRSHEEMVRRAVSLNNLGELLKTQGDVDGALRAYQQARTSLLAPDASGQGSEAARTYLGIVNLGISRALDAKGDVSGAETFAGEAVAIYERLASQDPSNAERQANLAWACTEYGVRLRATGKLDESLKVMERARDLVLKPLERNPDDRMLRRRLAAVHDHLGEIQKARGQMDEAMKSGLKAVEIFEKLAAEAPRDIVCQQELGIRLNTAAVRCRDSGNAVLARELDRRAIEMWEGLTAQDPTNGAWQHYLANALGVCVSLQILAGEFDGATTNLDRLLGIRATLVAKDAGNTEWLRGLRQAWDLQSKARSGSGDWKGALENAHRANDVSAKLVTQSPRNIQFRYEWSQGLVLEGDALKALGRPDDARAAYLRAKELLDALTSEGTGRPVWREDLKRVEEAIRDLGAAPVP